MQQFTSQLGELRCVALLVGSALENTPCIQLLDATGLENILLAYRAT